MVSAEDAQAIKRIFRKEGGTRLPLQELGLHYKRILADPEYKKAFVKHWAGAINGTASIPDFAHVIQRGFDVHQTAPIQTHPDYKEVRRAAAHKLKELNLDPLKQPFHYDLTHAFEVLHSAPKGKRLGELIGDLERS
jgi:hypothetical protein